ncbi:MAG TPA: PDZ domain-containing protein, partial [Vicinamibacterales bacterium]
FAWDAAPWWSEDQLLNLRSSLDMVKRRYNVDENRVALSGVSDGGTGAYYVSMRDTTPYASFLPLNGYWGVLAVHDLDIDGSLFPGNMRNKPFFIVNGERDPLYPTSLVEPAIAHYKKVGLTFEYRPQAGAGHNTQWWPQVKPTFDAFVGAHPRQPLPDVITWETTQPSGAARFNRAHWIVIDSIGAFGGDSPLDDPNLIASQPRPDFGARSIGNHINRVMPGSNAERMGLKAGDALVRLNDQTVHVAVDVEEIVKSITPGSNITLLVARDNAPVELAGVYAPTQTVDPPHPMFDRGVPSGRVDAAREGNTVTVKTRGVTAFTLLLSPDQFDLDQPVRVVVNGHPAPGSKVEKSVRTLMKRAAADNDRTMLFGAELRINLR